MKKLALLLSLIILVLIVPTTFAINDGTPDGNAHPYVGLLAAYDANGRYLWRCSGTQLSPTVFLTAGHCVEAPAVTAKVWFAADMRNTGYTPWHTTPANATGTVYVHPDYDPGYFYYRDLGVVVFDAPYHQSAYGVLPSVNVLDVLERQRGHQDQTFTVVGYGLQQVNGSTAQLIAELVRLYATPRLIQLNAPGSLGDFSLRLSNNANTGGTCYGDSGGPAFIGSSNVLGGVTSYVMNNTCGGTGGIFRLDRSWSVDWVNGFLN